MNSAQTSKFLLVLAAAVMAGSCASGFDSGVPVSEAEIRRLLVGRWYHLDSADDEFELPQRFEVIFAPDGTCTHWLIPKDPTQPPGITDGKWQLTGRSIAFHWTPRNSVAPKHPISDGPIHHLNRHRLEFKDPDYESISFYYRSYRESRKSLVAAPKNQH